MLFFCEEFSIDRRMTNRLIPWSLVVSLFFAVSIAASAQTATPTPSEGAAQNVKLLDPAATTQAWLATVPQEKREKSDAYFEGGYWLILWNFLLAAGISIFLLASRISARLRDFAERICRGSFIVNIDTVWQPRVSCLGLVNS
jgi:STE24 endopeptidase